MFGKVLMTKIINLYGGPGTGKSTIASDLFSLMKWKNINVELVNEYAKELTWDGRHNILKDQLYVVTKQNRKLERLRDKVDYVITDCPIIMGLAYEPIPYYKYFGPLIKEIFESYENVNFFLKRDKPFHTVGRNQTESEAIELDSIIKNILDMDGIPYKKIKADNIAKHLIYEELFGGN